MITNNICRPKGCQIAFRIVTSVTVIILNLVACSTWNIDLVEYTPNSGDEWEVSRPDEQGLDAKLVDELYFNAAKLPRFYGLLVIKNGCLIAERYFNEGALDQEAFVASVSKSYISALVGIALDQGYLTSLDQKMMDFFPEFVDQVTDPRKMRITIRDLLKMRSGYMWEEKDDALEEALYAGDLLPLIVDFPLASNPGSEFNYSNLTSYILGVIVARASDMDLKSFAQEYLLSPIGSDVGVWFQDDYGYYHSYLGFTARDMARFGLLYLNDGVVGDRQIISADWVHDSFKTYTKDAWKSWVGWNFRDIGYGYQWWSARAGKHHFNLAWGHGGQLIVVVGEFDMVIVTISDPFFRQHSWEHERGAINLVSNFINSLPKE